MAEISKVAPMAVATHGRCMLSIVSQDEDTDHVSSTELAQENARGGIGCRPSRSARSIMVHVVPVSREIATFRM
jgi:hypothetical protein